MRISKICSKKSFNLQEGKVVSPHWCPSLLREPFFHPLEAEPGGLGPTSPVSTAPRGCTAGQGYGQLQRPRAPSWFDLYLPPWLRLASSDPNYLTQLEFPSSYSCPYISALTCCILLAAVGRWGNRAPTPSPPLPFSPPALETHCVNGIFNFKRFNYSRKCQADRVRLFQVSHKEYSHPCYLPRWKKQPSMVFF